MPRFSTQRGSVDNPGNARAHTATIAMIIPRTVSICELIHASSAKTCPAGRSSFIRSIPADQRGPRRFVTRRQVSALSSVFFVLLSGSAQCLPLAVKRFANGVLQGLESGLQKTEYQALRFNP